MPRLNNCFCWWCLLVCYILRLLFLSHISLIHVQLAVQYTFILISRIVCQHMSRIVRHISYVVYFVSCIVRRVSYVVRCTSFVIYHASYIVCTSRIVYPMFVYRYMQFVMCCYFVYFVMDYVVGVMLAFVNYYGMVYHFIMPNTLAKLF